MITISYYFTTCSTLLCLVKDKQGCVGPHELFDHKPNSAVLILLPLFVLFFLLTVMVSDLINSKGSPTLALNLVQSYLMFSEYFITSSADVSAYKCLYRQ